MKESESTKEGLKEKINLSGWLLPGIAIALVIGGLAVVVGMNDDIGTAHKGSVEEMQRQFNAMEPQKQIDNLGHWPIPAAEREKRIQEIEKKYGIKRASPGREVIPSGAPSPETQTVDRKGN